MPGLKRRLRLAWTHLKDRLFPEPPLAAPGEMPAHYLPGIGKGEFERVGREFVDLFGRYGDLGPSDRILDVGCGLGRMVKPLKERLGPEGSYEGFDVVYDIIRWNQRNVSQFDPRFQFRFVDVYNSSYNPEGHIRPERFRFPYRDGEFDFVFATSVFTHLLEASVARYLAECVRVLKPGGRFFGTFFLLDEESRRRIEAGDSDIDFRHPWELGLLMSEDKPEDAVAYRIDWVFERLDSLGLAIRQPVHFGFWSGREGLSYQDVVIGDKRP